MDGRTRPKKNGIRKPIPGTMSATIWATIDRHYRVYGRATTRAELEAAHPSFSRATMATVLRNYRMFHDLPDNRTGLTVKQKLERAAAREFAKASRG